MSTTKVIAYARGETAAVTLPSNAKFDPPLGAPKYLSITLVSDTSRRGIFEVSKNPRAGAEGKEIYLQPGQLKLKYGEQAEATAEEVSVWAYRLSQLNTPTGLLVLGTLISAFTVALIDGSVAMGNYMKPPVFLLEAQTFAVLSGISMICKWATAIMAALLALWFKK
jgi:hypothetical protein